MGVLDYLKSWVTPQVTLKNLRTVEKKDPDLAQHFEDVKKAIELGYDKSPLRTYYAMLMQTIGKPKEAEEMYIEAVAAKESIAKYEYGIFLSWHHLSEEAEVLAKELLAEGWNPRLSNYLMGMIYEDMEEYEKAIKYYRKALKLGDVDAHTRILSCLLRSGRKEEAKEALEKMMKVKGISRNLKGCAFCLYARTMYGIEEIRMYEQMYCDYKEFPWTYEKEQKYRELVENDAKYLRLAYEFDPNHNHKGILRSAENKLRFMEERMAKIKEMAENWQTKQIEYEYPKEDEWWIEEYFDRKINGKGEPAKPMYIRKKENNLPRYMPGILRPTRNKQR